jgi:hypothetical protein
MEWFWQKWALHLKVVCIKIYYLVVNNVLASAKKLRLKWWSNGENESFNV